MTDLSYPDWLNYVFDHAVPFDEEVWHHEAEADWWQPSAALAVDYLARLFENPEGLVDAFSDSQIAQSLQYLIDNGAGGYCRFLTDGSVPLESRAACIEGVLHPVRAPVPAALRAGALAPGRGGRQRAQRHLLHVVGHHPVRRRFEAAPA
jgi:hypothetical protein